MKYIFPLLCLFAFIAAPSFAQTAEKKPYVVYAEFVADTPVDLSDGSKWVMDKGDCFPIHMYKERHTQVILKLADATFMTPVYTVRVMKPNEEKNAVEKYQKMVDNYLNARAKNLKK